MSSAVYFRDVSKNPTFKVFFRNIQNTMVLSNGNLQCIKLEDINNISPVSTQLT